MLMPAFIISMVILYTLIAVFALFMTRQEQRQTQNTNPFWHALSALACLCWPVTVIVVALTIILQRKASAPAPALRPIPVASE